MPSPGNPVKKIVVRDSKPGLVCLLGLHWESRARVISFSTKFWESLIGASLDRVSIIGWSFSQLAKISLIGIAVALTSADNCFLVIAKRLKLVDRQQTRQLLAYIFKERSETNVLIEEAALALEFLSQGDLERVLRIRKRYGRECRSCKNMTYLLPDQQSKQTPCEICHSRLIPTRQTARQARKQLLDETNSGEELQTFANIGMETSAESEIVRLGSSSDPIYADANSAAPESHIVPNSGGPGTETRVVDPNAPAADLETRIGSPASSTVEPLLATKPNLQKDSDKSIKEKDAKQLDDELIGLVLDGYRVTEKIAMGGMGALYLARHPILDKNIVIKTLFPRHSHNGTRLQRFIREARAASLLEHPNIVPVINIAQYREGHFYLTMPFIEGKNLDEIVRESGAFSMEKALNTALDVASALATAHANDIIHRDIKPNNLLIDDCGITKVTDFGLAKILSSQEKLTKPGMFVGTPLYMAPEIGRAKELDGRVDVYGLGLTLYYILTGFHAFQRATVADLMMQRAHKQIVHPNSHGILLPDSVVNILGKMLAIDTTNRYQSMEVLTVDLKAALNSELVDLPVAEIWRKW